MLWTTWKIWTKTQIPWRRRRRRHISCKEL